MDIPSQNLFSPLNLAVLSFPVLPLFSYMFNQQKLSNNLDSAFTSPTSPFSNLPSQSKPTTTTSSSSGWDSAFASSTDNTPTHHPHSQNQNQNQNKLEFADDPFKDSNFRYGDPFELAGADPFKGKEDPFTSPVDAAFGNVDPAAASASAVTEKSNYSDPFSLTTLQSQAPPTATTNPPSDSFSLDPFAPSPKVTPATPQKSSADPFGSDPFSPFSGQTSASKSRKTQDDWFNAANAGRPPRTDGVVRLVFIILNSLLTRPHSRLNYAIKGLFIYVSEPCDIQPQ